MIILLAVVLYLVFVIAVAKWIEHGRWWPW